MAAGKYSFIIEQGTTYDQYINIKDTNQDLLDLSEYTASAQLKSGPGGDKHADFTSSIELTSGSTTKGTVRLYLSADTTSTLAFDTALYDIELRSGSYVTRLLQGRVKLSKEITT
tara:strand:- start:670 stop:1014 length:345 start_codon:yes stop_codon:yes gene_type:complete